MKMYMARVQNFIFHFFRSVDLFQVGLPPRRYQNITPILQINSRSTVSSLKSSNSCRNTAHNRSLFNTLLTTCIISYLEFSTSSSTLQPLRHGLIFVPTCRKKMSDNEIPTLQLQLVIYLLLQPILSCPCGLTKPLHQVLQPHFLRSDRKHMQ